MSGLRTLAWVDEVMPDVVQHGDWDNPDERIEFHDERLSVPMRNHLLRTVGSNGEGDTLCDANECGQVVGYLLVDARNVGGGERLDWLWTSVAEFPDGRILLLCEECTPSNLYPEK